MEPKVLQGLITKLRLFWALREGFAQDSRIESYYLGTINRGLLNAQNSLNLVISPCKTLGSMIRERIRENP